MTLKALLMPWLAQAITSPGLRELRRRLAELRRRLLHRPHRIHCYLRLDDPWSWLLAQVLGDFVRHYRLEMNPQVLLWMDQQMYPQPEMLARFAPLDARRLAEYHGLTFPAEASAPDPEAAFRATRILLRHEHSPDFLALFHELAVALWSRDDAMLEQLARQHGMQAADRTRLTLEARRDRFLDVGHYLSATVHYEGEWYWSVERLDHLAARLETLMPQAPAQRPMDYGAPKFLHARTPVAAAAGHTLEFFFSFRSPYSWVALERTFRLADRHGLNLEIRPVLPMVMRGLAVPPAKRMYILRDAAREAALHEVDFGRVCDPLGAGVERCMALWPFAEKEGKLRNWLATAGRGIWSRGIDAASDRGLERLCRDAGLEWHRARRWLDDDGWRTRAEENRAAMEAAGSWGVPTFRFNGETVWGQDRFAILERLLEQSPSQPVQQATQENEG